MNGIAPGLIATRFHDRFTTAEGRTATVGRTPLRREGVPEDVAAACLFVLGLPPHAHVPELLLYPSRL